MSQQNQDPTCPRCNSENAYSDGNLWNCPDCSHEWNPASSAKVGNEMDDPTIRDAYGTVLQDGDSVTLIKDLKIKGSSTAIKVGTKVKSIRLMDTGDGHNIGCRIDGFGAINLKSEFVKKA